MLYFKAKMSQTQWGAYSATQPLAGFKEPTSEEKEGRERKGKGGEMA